MEEKQSFSKCPFTKEKCKFARMGQVSMAHYPEAGALCIACRLNDIGLTLKNIMIYLSYIADDVAAKL